MIIKTTKKELRELIKESLDFDAVEYMDVNDLVEELYKSYIIEDDEQDTLRILQNIDKGKISNVIKKTSDYISKATADRNKGAQFSFFVIEQLLNKYI